MTTLSPQDILQQTRNLWRTCFNDSEEFMDIYFTQKFPRAENFYETADGRIVAAVQTFAYDAFIGGKSVKTSYISGLGVLPDYRGRGLAERLIRRVLRRDEERGVALSFLIPGNEGLRDFYRRERHGGYETCSHIALLTMEEKVSALPHFDICLDNAPGSALYDFYIHFLKHHTNTLLPTAVDFCAAIATCRLDGGHLVVARRDETILGMALARPHSDGEWMLTDFAAADSEIAATMIAWMRSEWRVPTISMLSACSSDSIGSRPYAMARIVNKDAFHSLSPEITSVTALNKYALRLPMMLDK